jgi:hypothetical protein
MPLLNGSGKITMLRAHVVGSGFGPPQDKIDVEVVFGVDTLPNKFFGFTLRNDGNVHANRAMFDLLRDAFEQKIRVGFDYEIGEGKQHGLAIRVWLTATSSTRPGRVGGVIREDVVIGRGG